MKILILALITLTSINCFAQLSSATNMTDPVAADEFWILDQSDSSALKAITFEEIFKNATKLKLSDDDTTCDASLAGTLRYDVNATDSALDMCMQTGASSYAWTTVKENTW